MTTVIPCTLWGFAFNPATVASIDWHYFEDGGIELTIEDYIGETLACKYLEEREDKQLEKEDVVRHIREAILLIANYL
jgi:hypothetical protein